MAPKRPSAEKNIQVCNNNSHCYARSPVSFCYYITIVTVSDATSVGGYIGFQYSYGNTCSGANTYAMGFVAGDCINSNATSYQIIMQNGKSFIFLICTAF